eukprot:TRINITY_DN1811_c0_g1_i1.p1 TRINITY_DN1811_c0_g1~~TRINITY_DN1811_c0_g1_i1.p1  ORF type:complete len:242 (-),score=88.61 TRINITY_DN1811_c0_g1_i1:91-777(-)
MSDAFAREYERLNKVADEITGDLQERTKLARRAEPTTSLTASISRKISSFSSALSTFQSTALSNDPSLRISEFERKKRSELISKLVSRKDSIQTMFKQTPDVDARDALLSFNARQPRSFGTQDTDRTQGVDNHDLVKMGRSLIQEQDKTLEMLGNTLTKQKKIGQEIGSEIDRHNSILEDIEIKVEYTSNNLDRETNRVKEFGQKYSVTVLWIIIGLLVVANVVVLIL